MTSKEALTNLKLDVSCRGKLSKFQQHCFDLLEKEFETPTFSECIKEWNEKGFDVDIYALEIVISGSTVEISIDVKDKTILIEGSPLPFDLIPLIYKTIRTLKVKEINILETKNE